MRTTVLIVTALLAAVVQAQDLDLVGAVRLAEQTRNSIRAASLRVHAAQLTLSSITILSPIRLETGIGTFPSLGAGEDFLVAMPFDLFGKNVAARDASAAALATAKAEFRQAKLDLQTDVINAYADMVSVQIQVRTSRSMLDLQQRLYDATKKRVDTGDLAPVDLLRSDLDLQRAKENLTLQSHALSASRQRLAAAIGVAPARVSEIDEKLTALPNNLRPKRPDVQLLEAAVRAAQAEAKISDRDRLPDLEVQFRRAPWGDPEQYNGRIQLVWNTLDWGAGSNRSKAARARREAAEHDLSDKRAFAEREIEAAKSEVLAAQASVDAFGRLRDDATKLVEKEQSAYELGGNTLLGVLEATRALREIEASGADAKLRLLQAQARLLAAQGILISEAS